MPDLIANLRTNKGVRRSAPRIEFSRLDLADIARHQVALQRNDVTLDDGESNLECLSFWQRYDFVFRTVLLRCNSPWFTTLERDEREGNTKDVYVFCCQQAGLR